MHIWKKAVGVLAMASTLTACEDYLSGPELTNDPNRPSNASVDQLFMGVQAAAFHWHTADLARTSSIWTQQMAGLGNQYQPYDIYLQGQAEDDFSGEFTAIYTQGGLIDLRNVQRMASEGGNQVLAGIAKVYEAYTIGMAASVWGAIPYSEAVTETETPKLDPQEQVYAAVQKLLDQAIADLQSGNQKLNLAGFDLVYGGNTTKWVQAANTLKARFYMHWVEAQEEGGASAAAAQVACGGQSCTQQAIAAAQKGISTPANNLTTYHAGKPGEENVWYQFIALQRPGYLGAGKNLVDLLQTRNDPRLAQYYARNSAGNFVGSAPGQFNPAASTLSATRLNPAFRQPLVTYAETQLILAEAHYRQNNPVQAIVHLNNARQSAGVSPVSGLTGLNLLREIMTEKYIALFQNMEVWNDWKRTCMPALINNADVNTSEMPRRLLYGLDERNVNPNIPAPNKQAAFNTNDPEGC